MQKKIYLFATTPHKDAISIKSLDIEFLSPKIDFSCYDYIIITSKHTITALKNYDRSSYIDKPFLCVSPKTASIYKDVGGVVLDIGDGYGDNLIHNIRKYPKDSKWLYLRAEVVVSSFVQIAKSEGYDIDEAVIYKSSCSSQIDSIRIDDDSTLIFTSPSSIECFLKNNTFHQNAKIIVIGTVSAAYLPNGIKYELSEVTTIDSCIQKALLS